MSARTFQFKRILLIAVPFLFARLLSAQGLPVAVAPETYIWLGRVPAFGPPVSHEFTLQNQGSAPLHILDVEKVCECASYRIEPELLPPGEAATIFLTIDPKGKRGEFAEGIRIRTDDPQNPSLTFLIRGEAYDRIQIEPELFDFGALPLDVLPASRISFQVEINDPGVEALGEVTPSSAALSCQVVPLGNKRYEIQVTLHPGLPDEFFEESLRLAFTGPKAEVVTAPVRGFIQGRVEPSRRFLSLSDFLQRTPMSQTVYLSHRTPFNILGVECPPWLAAQHAPLPEAERKAGPAIQKLVLTLDPACLPAAVPLTRIRVRTDLPGSPQVFLLVFDDRHPPGP